MECILRLLVGLLAVASAARERESPLYPPPTVPAPPPYLVAPIQVDTVKLRQLAYLQQCFVSFETGDIFGLRLDPKTKQRVDPAKRIAELDKQIKGDPSDAERYLELSELYEDQSHWEQAVTKAHSLFKERIKAEPANGSLHARYAITAWPNTSEGCDRSPAGDDGKLVKLG